MHFTSIPLCAPRLVAFAILIGASCLGVRPVPAWGAPTAPAERREDTFEEYVVRAKAQREAENHAKAAQLFDAAYRALDEEQQAGAKGEFAVNNAVDDYRQAQDVAPGELSLFEDEAALLDHFEANPRRDGAMPPGLAEEQERIWDKILQLRIKEEEQAKTELAKALEEEEAAAARAAEALAAARAAEATAAREIETKIAASILSVGLVSVVGGTTLIANGVWNIGNVERSGDRKLSDIEASTARTEEERKAVAKPIRDWQQRWRVIGTGVAVSGAVLLSAGVGLTSWGAVRMRRRTHAEDRVSTVRPMIFGGGIGLMLEGRY